MDGIAGNALVVCSDADGDFTDCDLPIKLFADGIRFLDLSKESLPEPRQVFVPIDGEPPRKIREGKADRRLPDAPLTTSRNPIP